MLTIASAAVPVLLRVTVWALLVVPTFRLLNVIVVAARLAMGAVPVPVRLTVCALPTTALLSLVMTSVALRAPMAPGVKVMLIVQFASTSTELPQLLDCEKSPGFDPPIVIAEMPSGAVPEFESVNDRVALGVLMT